MDVLTLPEVMWHIGPSNMCWQDLLNLWKSSNNVSLVFYLAGIGGITLAKLKELYSLTMVTFGYYLVVGGGGGRTGSLTTGNPPVAPNCSGVSALPVSASFNWFMNNWVLTFCIVSSSMLSWSLIGLLTAVPIPHPGGSGGVKICLQIKPFYLYNDSQH